MVQITGEPGQQESRSPFTRVTCGNIPPAPFGFVYRAGRPCPHFSSGFGTDTLALSVLADGDAATNAFDFEIGTPLAHG